MVHRLMPLLAALALWAAPAASGAVVDDDGTPELDAKVRGRLLHLVGGGVMRAESRFRDGAWEVRDEDGWRPLPAGAVVSARLEKEVVAEARKRRTLARRRGPAERVAAAEWMVDEGLLTEAFEELEDILADDRDQPDALELLHTGRLPVAVPPHVPSGASEERARKHHAVLLAWAAPMPVTLHELATLCNQRLAPISYADETFDDALQAHISRMQAIRSAGLPSSSPPPAGDKEEAQLLQQALEMSLAGCVPGDSLERAIQLDE